MRFFNKGGPTTKSDMHEVGGTGLPLNQLSHALPETPAYAPAPLGGIVDSVTTIGGKPTQQDAVEHLDWPGIKLVVVADGVSGCAQSQLASQTAMHAVMTRLFPLVRDGYPVSTTTLHDVVNDAHCAVLRQAKLRGFTRHGPATTLIVATEQADRYQIAYVGDGAAVFTQSSLQWMGNLLYPQTGDAGALSHYVGMSRPTIEPAVIELPKVHDDRGILVIGTDGALPLGSVLSTTESLLNEIQSAVLAADPPDIHGLLEIWVTKRLATDDNRSLAVIISAAALEAWQCSVKHAGDESGCPADGSGASASVNPECENDTRRRSDNATA